MIKYLMFLVGTILLVPFSNFAQGNLMLVGGGSEDDGGWSDSPYAWMIENAQNKKVGIISYSDADEWLPNYFKDLGAAVANNIKISSRDEAESSVIYDELVEYDALFFKGGDQNKYYDYYKGTPVHSAVEAIYNRGGVIGGTSAGLAILSGVIFTAEEGSAYPYDVLENINSRYITLKDDFLNFYPGYLFDSHFIERGRTARLIGFLAHWYHNQNEFINGIGVDDRTAFCINEDGIGTVYGTGAASIYLPRSFKVEAEQLVDSDVQSIQLTHGQQFDLNNEAVAERSLGEFSDPTNSMKYIQVFGSSSGNLEANNELLNKVLASDISEGNVIIIAKEEGSLANSYKTFFETNQNQPVHIITTTTENNEEDKVDLRNTIRQSGLVILLENDELLDFIKGGATGSLLSQHLKRNKFTSVFLGEIVNLIGKSFCNNIYSDPLNAYYDDLIFSEGLNLLSDFTIVANSFDPDAKDYYENISSGVVDRVLQEDLVYGLYLTNNNYFSYTLTQLDEVILEIGGNYSSLLVQNRSTRFQQTNQKVNGNTSRLQYGFDSLNYRITKGEPINLGSATPAQQEEYEMEEEPVLTASRKFLTENILLKNPVNDYLEINLRSDDISEVQIFDLKGILVLHAYGANVTNKIKVGILKEGRYNMLLIYKKTNNKHRSSVLIMH
jgi:cyanophycinase